MGAETAVGNDLPAPIYDAYIPTLWAREEAIEATVSSSSFATPTSSTNSSSSTEKDGESSTDLADSDTDESFAGSDLSKIPARCIEACTQWNQTLYKYSQCSDALPSTDAASGEQRSCAADKAPGARVICEVS